LELVSAPEVPRGGVELALDDRIETAPRSGSLARAERPSGVAAKDASACNSLASNKSTIALMA
jgi:hypothetical protein